MTSPVLESALTRMPRLGLGTWPMDAAAAETAVATAIETGYRLVDTDSEGKPLSETEQPSGADAPETKTDPIGDNNGGVSAVTPPPAR